MKYILVPRNTWGKDSHRFAALKSQAPLLFQANQTVITFINDTHLLGSLLITQK